MSKLPKVLLFTAVSLPLINFLFIGVLVLFGYPTLVSFNSLHGVLLRGMALLATLIPVPFVLRANRQALMTLPLVVLVSGICHFIAGGVELTRLGVITYGYWLVIAVFSYLAILADEQVLALIEDPSKRWWLSSPRKQLKLRVDVQNVKGQSIPLRTFDISQSGAFIPSNTFIDLENELQPGDQILLNLHLGDQSIKCNARVARVVRHPDRYPRGMGLQFMGIDRQSKRLLKRYITNQVNSPPPMTV